MGTRDPDHRAVNQAVGRRVRQLRGRLVTQQQLAEAIGLSRGSVANIEAGRQGLDVPMLLSVADALGVEPTDLLPEETS